MRWRLFLVPESGECRGQRGRGEGRSNCHSVATLWELVDEPANVYSTRHAMLMYHRILPASASHRMPSSYVCLSLCNVRTS